MASDPRQHASDGSQRRLGIRSQQNARLRVQEVSEPEKISQAEKSRCVRVPFGLAGISFLFLFFKIGNRVHP